MLSHDWERLGLQGCKRLRDGGDLDLRDSSLSMKAVGENSRGFAAG
jgi:hypothetical protein